jgi:hypothetical protein
MNPETFSLDFGDGTRISARVNVTEIARLPADKLRSVVAFNWEGPRHNRHWSRYLAWVKTVWQSVADTAGKSILSLFAAPTGERFAVHFHPRRPAETVRLP